MPTATTSLASCALFESVADSKLTFKSQPGIGANRIAQLLVVEDVSNVVNTTGFAGVIAWQVGRSVSHVAKDGQMEAAELGVEEWATKHTNPKRRRLAHGIRYGFIAGLGGEAALPAWSSPDYVAAYEAAWNLGNAIAIEADPR